LVSQKFEEIFPDCFSLISLLQMFYQNPVAGRHAQFANKKTAKTAVFLLI